MRPRPGSGRMRWPPRVSGAERRALAWALRDDGDRPAIGRPLPRGRRRPDDAGGNRGTGMTAPGAVPASRPPPRPRSGEKSLIACADGPPRAGLVPQHPPVPADGTP